MNVNISGSNSAIGKGCATVFLSVFAIAGLVFLGFFCWAGWDTVRAYTWTKTDCVIESSELREKGDSADFDVRYTYRFAGRNYTGTRYTVGMGASTSTASAQRAVQRYPQGGAAVCYVNASSPGESALRRGDLWPLLFGLIPIAFVAFGVGGIIGVWRAKPASPVSERLRGGTGGVLAMRLFGSVFMLVGVAAIYAILIRPFLKEMVASKWPQVPCEITSSKVGQHSGSKGGSTYSVDVRYRYTVGGRELIGTNYNFDTGTSGSLGWRAVVVTSLPPGKKTVCYVNPDDPLDAVLSVKGSPDRWFGFIPGLFFVVGLFIFLKAPSAGRRSSVVPVSVVPPSSVPDGISGSFSDMSSLRGDATAGETELKPTTPPGWAFIAATVIALIWNGTVWTILLLPGSRDTGVRIFLGVFAVIGLGIAAAAVHQFLALFNPRPVLTVSRPAVPLGGVFEVRWRITGNVRRMVKLSISLTAREEATYRRGTDNTTDTNIFVNTVLLDSADHAQFADGSATVEIPRNSIHTFTASNNKIVWALRVHGVIPKWPDVNSEFLITVLPCDASTLLHEQPTAQ